MQLIAKILISVCVASTMLACSEVDTTSDVAIVRPVKLMEINLKNEKVINFPGEVTSSDRADLAFRVPGKIIKYHINSGEKVSKDQLLIELDPNDYQMTLNARQANYDLARVQHDRSISLVKDFLISQQEFDNTKTEMQVAESKLNSAKADLSYTKILAPYDGIIAATYNKNFEYVNAQQPIMAIQAIDGIDVNVAVPERLIAPIKQLSKRGSKSQLTVSFPVKKDAEYEAIIKEVGTVADADTGSYLVRLTLPRPKEANIYPGMTAIVHCQLTLSDGDLNTQIPETALLVEGEQVFVWKYDPNSQLVEKVAINLDPRGTITAGLSDGELIVTSGANELKSGQKVKPWNKERGL